MAATEESLRTFLECSRFAAQMGKRFASKME
jgi:hypothetical protein